MQTGDARLFARAAGIAREAFRDDHGNAVVVSVLATVILPALIGTAVGFLPGAPGSAFWLLPLALCALVGAQGWLAFRLARKPQTTGPLLVALAEADQRLLEEARALAATKASAERLGHLQAWSLSAYAHAAGGLDETGAAKDFLDRLLGPVADNVPGFFSFGAEDVWAIALYAHDRKADELRCVWRRMDPRHPANGRSPRSWPPSQGHIGQTFSRPNAPQGVVTSDATHPDVREHFEGHGERLRDYDTSAYRSFASFLVTDRHGRAGVLIGTSSRIGAFDLDAGTSDPLRHAAAALSAFLRGAAFYMHLFDWSSASPSGTQERDQRSPDTDKDDDA
jgi:hypothetical protein